ncbi:MAG: serine hydrolase domain-containing protein, partial [Gammaproteobacteria bacterium]
NSGLRVTPDTLFQYGSITKALTSTLVLRLVQQGLVALDAPVTDYVPEFRPASAELAKRITVRQLLAHSSGLPGTIFRDTGWGEDALRANVELINQHPQYVEPGLMFSYWALVREAWSTQSRPPTDLLTRRWGLGWTLYDWARGVEVVGHNGSTAGTISFLRIHPATESAVALLVNSSNGLLLHDEVFSEVFRALTGVWEPGVPASAPGFTPEPARYEGVFEDIHGRVSRYTMNVGKERTRQVERSALCTLDNGERYFHDGYLALKQVR